MWTLQLLCARGLSVVLLSACLVACASTGMAPTGTTLTQERIAQIVASPDRSAADRTNDQRRHPVDMPSFIGVRPGWTGLGVSTGGGYTSELLARAIGPSGTVYAQSQPRDPNKVAPFPLRPKAAA